MEDDDEQFDELKIKEQLEDLHKILKIWAVVNEVQSFDLYRLLVCVFTELFAVNDFTQNELDEVFKKIKEKVKQIQEHRKKSEEC